MAKKYLTIAVSILLVFWMIPLYSETKIHHWFKKGNIEINNEKVTLTWYAEEHQHPSGGQTQSVQGGKRVEAKMTLDLRPYIKDNEVIDKKELENIQERIKKVLDEEIPEQKPK